MLARSDGTVVDGHLRIKAARKFSINEIPVILCDEWSEAQVKAFRLTVNAGAIIDHVAPRERRFVAVEK